MTFSAPASSGPPTPGYTPSPQVPHDMTRWPCAATGPGPPGWTRQPRARQVFRVIARRAHRHQPVAFSLDHQRRRIDAGQHTAPVFFLEQAQAGAQRRRHRFAMTEYFAQTAQYGAVVTGRLQSQETIDGAGIILFQVLRELFQHRGWHGVRPVR